MAKFEIGNPGGGRPRGAKNRITRIREQFAGDIPALVDKLKELALGGDVGALRLLLSYEAPPPKISDVVLEDCAELADLPPDLMLDEVNRRVALGQMPLEHGRILSDLARQRMEAQVISKLRQIQAAIRDGADLKAVLKSLTAMDLGDGVDLARADYLN